MMLFVYTTYFMVYVMICWVLPWSSHHKWINVFLAHFMFGSIVIYLFSDSPVEIGPGLYNSILECIIALWKTGKMKSRSKNGLGHMPLNILWAQTQMVISASWTTPVIPLCSRPLLLNNYLNISKGNCHE